jgi:hypothetical protein
MADRVKAIQEEVRKKLEESNAKYKAAADLVIIQGRRPCNYSRKETL